MIRKFLLPALMLLASCSGPPQPSPDLNLADSPEANGRWMVINYWAIWCHPCREEIPELNLLAQRHPDKLAVFGVNYDGAEGEQLAVQTTELGITFTQLRADPASKLGYPRPTVLPTTLLIDPQGQVAGRLLGPQTEHSILRAIEESAPP